MPTKKSAASRGKTAPRKKSSRFLLSRASFRSPRALLIMGVLVVTGLVIAVTYAATTTLFSDNFNAYRTGTCRADGSSFGRWYVNFAGGGCTKVIANASGTWLHQSPATATAPNLTHAALTTGPSFNAPYTYSVKLKTTKQLRSGSAPNPWEVGWVIWNYTDNSHFYYFTPKPNGWELGKEDPTYPGAQRFLATGASPTFPVGTAYTIEITQSTTNLITVKVNGRLVTSFTDAERPYSSGKIGLYTEDAAVNYTNVAVTTPLVPEPTPTPSGGVTPPPSSSPTPTPLPTPTPPTGMRPLPDPLYGVTVDDVANVANIVASSQNLARKPTTRIVFDENVKASYYTTAVSQLQPVSYLMGEILDSSYVKSYTAQAYHDRVAEYLAAFGDKIDLWEIGNEINGEWLGITTSVTPKMIDAYNQVKASGKRAALTLYYNPNCWSSPSNEMFTWANANVPTSMKQGLDYVLISYYEVDCNNYRPSDWTPVFQRLHDMFPNSRIGFSEVGLSNPATSTTLSKATSILEYYYGLRPQVPGYIGGYFWWYYYEDMLPYTSKPLWQTLNSAIQKY